MSPIASAPMQLTLIPGVYMVHTVCVQVCVIPMLACLPTRMPGTPTALSLSVSLLAIAPSSNAPQDWKSSSLPL